MLASCMAPDLQPDWLKPALDELAWLHLSPGGGERYGTLLVVALSLSTVPDLDAATTVLWKRALCIEEEWPYCAWTSADLEAAPIRLSWNTVEVERLPDGRLDDPDVDWLVGRGRDVVVAQRTVEQPVNPWRASTTAWAGDPLDGLTFATPSTLRRVLSRRWNDTVAVFEHDGFAYHVSWSTSA